MFTHYIYTWAEDVVGIYKWEYEVLSGRSEDGGSSAGLHRTIFISVFRIPGNWVALLERSPDPSSTRFTACLTLFIVERLLPPSWHVPRQGLKGGDALAQRPLRGPTKARGSELGNQLPKAKGEWFSSRVLG